MHFVTRTPGEVQLCMEITGANVHVNSPKIVKMLPETIPLLKGVRKSDQVEAFFFCTAHESIKIFKKP